MPDASLDPLGLAICQHPILMPIALWDMPGEGERLQEKTSNEKLEPHWRVGRTLSSGYGRSPEINYSPPTLHDEYKQSK